MFVKDGNMWLLKERLLVERKLLILVIGSTGFHQELVSLWKNHVMLLGTTVNICRRGIVLPLLCVLWET